VRSMQPEISASVYHLSRGYWVTKSMTAIVRTLTPGGFVLAADGRKSGAIDGAVLSDSVQKIFPIKTFAGSFAYSIAGTIELPTDNNLEVALNLAEEIRKSADSLEKRKTRNLAGYAVRLCRPVYQALKNARESGRISLYPSYETNVSTERGDTIIRISLDGFRDGYPSSVVIRIFHENGVLGEPEIFTEPNHLGLHRASGRPEIGRLLWETDDPRLAAYRGPRIFAEDMTLQDAIDRSQSYIRAHADPAAHTIDPECRRTGGHIHVATITPPDGFKWIVEPIPNLNG